MAGRGEKVNGRDFYDILEVPPSASYDQLKAAYRDLVRQYHPDLYRTYFQKIWATKKLQDINAAYSVLRDPRSRQEYDQHHAKARPERQTEDRPKGPSPAVVDLEKRRKDELINRIVPTLLLIAWAVGAVYIFLQLPHSSILSIVGGILAAGIGSVFFVVIVLGGAAYCIMLFWVIVVEPFMTTWKRAGAHPTDLKKEFAFRIGFLGLIFLVLLPYILFVMGFSMPQWLLLPSGILLYFTVFAVPMLLSELIALLVYAAWARRVVAETQALAVIE